MTHRLISGDNHIDITQCPPDLWADPPAEFAGLAPRVEELDDGCHWFIEGRDMGIWNGVGPAFRKHIPGKMARIDYMKSLGFVWDHRPGAQPRTTSPEMRLADLDRDGQDAEVVYGCLQLNKIIQDHDLRVWCDQRYNDWVLDFAKRADPDRVFPLALIPNTDPQAAAAEVRRCAAMGLRGGEMTFRAAGLPLYHRDWDVVWAAAQECAFPISFHTTGYKHALRPPDTPEIEREYALQIMLIRMSLFQCESMEVLTTLLMSGACERYPGFKFVLAESGVTWLPYVFDRLDTIFAERGRAAGLTMKPSAYFRRQGYATFQQDDYLAPVVPLIGEDNIIWGADYPHPDCVWPDSRATLDRVLAGTSAGVRRKITCDNVAALYGI